jgi:protein-tyrosine phosphatase
MAWMDIHCLPLQELRLNYSGKLYLGPYLGTDLEDIEEIQVKVVISLGFDERPWPEGDGLVNYYYDVNDDTHYMTRMKMLLILPEIATKIHEHLANGDNVFVHCQMGISRSPTAILWFLTKLLGVSLAEAWDFLKKHRPCVHPNRSFRTILN